MKGTVEEIVFVDRYSATGTPYPDSETVCQGHCEGMGCYPCKNDDEIEPLEMVRWLECHNAPDAHQDEPCDGWHFIKCLDCDGTGKKLIPIIKPTRREKMK